MLPFLDSRPDRTKVGRAGLNLQLAMSPRALPDQID